MPTQVMITHLGNATAQQMIAAANAQELLIIEDSKPDPNNANAFMLICTEKAGRPLPEAVTVMQKIADEDSRAVRAAAPKEPAVAPSAPPAPPAKK